MTAAAIVRAAATAGVRIRVDGDNLVLSAPARPDDRILEELRSAKMEVLAYVKGLRQRTEDDWNALYDERSGMMEFDGGLTRAEAEAKAADEVHHLRSLVRSGDGNDNTAGPQGFSPTDNQHQNSSLTSVTSVTPYIAGSPEPAWTPARVEERIRKAVAMKTALTEERRVGEFTTRRQPEGIGIIGA